MRPILFAIVLLVLPFSARAQNECDPPPVIDEDWCTEDCSPIVIHLGRGEYELTGADSPVLFDIRANGRPVRMGWTAAGGDHAFLSLDRNGNGAIDDGSELFGNAMRLRDGRRARNGFVALAEHDHDGNGVIDVRDPIWRDLLLWTDVDHDGVSRPHELMPIDDSSVAAIDLTYHWTGRRDVSGNAFRYDAQLSMRSAAGHITRRPLYDIFFVIVR